MPDKRLISEENLNEYNKKIKSYVNDKVDKKQDIIQYSTVPTVSASLVGKIIQFTGTTEASYTNGHFYRCVENSNIYSWEEIIFGSNITVDSSLSTTSENPVQNKVITEALNDKSGKGIARLI